MITVFGFPKSRSTRVLWLLEEIELDYRYRTVNFSAPDAEFVQASPGLKVPVLVEDDFCLTESGAILNYLADRYAPGELIPPAGSHDRARCDQWCYFVLTELEQPLWNMAKHRFALPEAQRIPAMQETAAWEFARACRTLAAGLKEENHLVGNQFSIADLLAAHTLAWAKGFKHPATQEQLQHYAELHLARPALQRAQEREQSA